MKAVPWLGAFLATATLAAPMPKPRKRPPAQWLPGQPAAPAASDTPALAPGLERSKAAAPSTHPDPEDITADLEALYRDGAYENTNRPPQPKNAASATDVTGALATGAAPPDPTSVTAASPRRGPPAEHAQPDAEGAAPPTAPLTEPEAERASLDEAPPELFPRDDDEAPIRAAAQASLSVPTTASSARGDFGFGSQFGLGVAGILAQKTKYVRVPDHAYESSIATHMELFYASWSEWIRWELYGQLAIYDFQHEDQTRRTPMLFAFGPGARLGLSRGGFDWLVGVGYATFMGDFQDEPASDAETSREPRDGARQAGCAALSTTLRSPMPSPSGRIFYTLQSHLCGNQWQQATGYRDGVYAHVFGIEASG